MAAERLPGLLAALLALALPGAWAAELTGKVSAVGLVVRTGEGDHGHDPGESSPTADQQSLRLMLDHSSGDFEWSAHLRATRFRADGALGRGRAAHQFRYRRMGGTLSNSSGEGDSERADYVVDRAALRLHGDRHSVGVGRQPVDWGSGRLWQPLNVFGAFAPTDLDTEYKPGIDAAVAEWFPTPFSSLTGAFVLSRRDGETNDNSAALRYRSLVGEESELTLLAGRVIGSNVIGGAFESAVGGTGWRVEAARYSLGHKDEDAWFAVAGIDRRFEDGTTVVAELHHNTHGASTQAEMAALADDPLVPVGLRQQLGRDVIGFAVSKDITALLNAQYLLLAAPLGNAHGGKSFSFAQQLSATYSLGNEAEVQLSVLSASGAGEDGSGSMRSEFGSHPDSISIRVVYYF